MGSALALAVAFSAVGSDAAPALEPRIAFRKDIYFFQSRIYTVRPDGSRRILLTRGRRPDDNSPAWSPDGRRLAFVREGLGVTGIWTSDANGRGARRLVRGEQNKSPAWSPDGRTIAFTRASTRGSLGLQSVYVIGTDGRGTRQLTRDHYDEDPVWSSDGRTILFSRHPPVDNELNWTWSTLMLVNADGTGLRPFPGGIHGREPAWSPSGRQIAFSYYQHRNGGRCILDRNDCYWTGELYVANADGTGLRRLSESSADETNPTWSPDGKWIAYARGVRPRGSRRFRIFRIRPNGEGRRLVVEMDRGVYEPAWRPR